METNDQIQLDGLILHLHRNVRKVSDFQAQMKIFSQEPAMSLLNMHCIYPEILQSNLSILEKAHLKRSSIALSDNHWCFKF